MKRLSYFKFALFAFASTWHKYSRARMKRTQTVDRRYGRSLLRFIKRNSSRYEYLNNCEDSILYATLYVRVFTVLILGQDFRLNFGHMRSACRAQYTVKILARLSPSHQLVSEINAFFFALFLLFSSTYLRFYGMCRRWNAASTCAWLYYL